MYIVLKLLNKNEKKKTLGQSPWKVDDGDE